MSARIDETIAKTGTVFLCALCSLCVYPSSTAAQTRVSILQAEDRRAPTAADLATIAAGARSADPQLARIGVRALGRLERPSTIPTMVPVLRHPAPEVRAEAANAIGQAAQGWGARGSQGAHDSTRTRDVGLDAALGALAGRAVVEGDADVRAALAETIGRLPYSKPAQVEKAERLLVEMDRTSVTDRLGVAKGLEVLIRLSRGVRPPGEEAIALLKHLAAPVIGEASNGARIRRLALEALIAAEAADAALVEAAVRDADAQVRRIAMRAAEPSTAIGSIRDDSPIVRIEALRRLKTRGSERLCGAALDLIADRSAAVALTAIDHLGSGCQSEDAISALDRLITDLSDAASPRGWHRTAHALVALATVAPARCAAVLEQFVQSRIWQLRMYAARAAAVLKAREALTRLAFDDNDNVREAAVDALRIAAGHEADSTYVAQLTRPGYQIIRTAALGLAGSPNRDAAIPALKVTLDRLIAEGRDNSHDARDAIAKALESLGEKLAAPKKPIPMDSVLTADDLRRLASPRARVTIRDVGTFELALFTAQAPATVLRFARLAESGYYNGLTFHRVVPNFVIQGGSPGANEYIGDASFMRDEVGLWPHVRGAVGISTRGRDTGDAQIFIDLVDNPRLDHQYTVFAQVLNGIDVVDRILEGDVIERIDIIP